MKQCFICYEFLIIPTQTSNTAKKNIKETHKINYVSFPSSPKYASKKKPPFYHNNGLEDCVQNKGI